MAPASPLKFGERRSPHVCVMSSFEFHRRGSQISEISIGRLQTAVGPYIKDLELRFKTHSTHASLG